MKASLTHLLMFGFGLAAPSAMPAGIAKAAYFASNMDAGNSIHALPIDSKGMLSQGRVTMTGGKGSRMMPVNNTADSLASQGSIAVSGNYLFVVNAGSNTLSMMAIDPTNPLKLTLVGKPADTLGDFPNSVAVSKNLGLACVTNTGSKSGITCFHVTSQGLTSDGQGLRALALDPMQSNPPNGPLNTVSQVFFNYDDTALLTTVKGDPATSTPTYGYFGSFPITKGVVSQNGVFSSPSGTAVLFGSVPLPGGYAFVTDASFGAVLLDLSSAGVASVVKKTTIPDQAATCWAAQNAVTGLLYTTDDGNEQVAAFEPKTGTMIKRNVLNAGVPNLIEITPAGSMLYALSHGNRTIPPHVVALQTTGKNGGLNVVQTFAPMHVGIHVEGLGVYMG